MQHSNQPADQLPTAFGQFYDSMLETGSQVNTTIDHAIDKMKGVKDTTLAEFSTHKTTMVELMQREILAAFEKVNTDMTLAEKQFAVKLNDVVEQEVVKVNDARKPLDNIPE